MATVGLLGLVVTSSVSWATWRIDRNVEHRLLQVQSRQAATVIQSAIVAIVSPLQTALGAALAANGNPAQFVRFMSSRTGPQGLFVSASLWRIDGGSPEPVASAGEPAELAPDSTAARTMVARALRSTTFVVTAVSTGRLPRIGYALADRNDPRFAVYAERAIPANRRVPVESNSAFSDLHFATYLGATTRSAALQTTDVRLTQLPLSGRTARETIPFGDTTLTLVTSPVGALGGALGARLQWLLLGGGVLLTVAAALVAGQLVRRRVHAETDTATIAALYAELDGLYGEQRTISETLQHALLPQSNPAIAELEIASRYVAGARGVDVGGDWYSMIRLDDTHFAFVVGDVSGRGVDAAALMARIRFTLRAYLVEGHSPDTALEMCSAQVDILRDGHIVTVLVGTGDLVTRQITLANAGHLNPLLVSQGQQHFVDTAVGLPLGVQATSYTPTTLVMPPGSMLIAYTDGLIERRGEDLALGFRRLSDAATSTEHPIDTEPIDTEPIDAEPIDDVLTAILSTMTGGGSEDDIAILAFRWASVEALEANDWGQAGPLVRDVLDDAGRDRLVDNV